MKLKTFLLLGTFLSFTFTGCTTLNQQLQKMQKGSSQIQQATMQEPIIAYFSKDAGTAGYGCDTGYSATAVSDGYYRKLLGRDHEGRFLAQDFYQEGNKPQTNPFWISTYYGLFQFGIEYVDGDTDLLYKSGKIKSKHRYKDGIEVGTSSYFRENGQEYKSDTINDDGTITQKLWYENRKPAADLTLDSSYTIISGSIWNEQGDLVEKAEEQDKILAQFNVLANASD